MATDSFAKETAIIVAMNRITGVRTLHHSNTWFWLSLNFLYKLVLMTGFIYATYYNNQILDKGAFNHQIYVMYMFMSILCVACAFNMQVLGWVYYKVRIMYIMYILCEYEYILSQEMSQLRKNIAETDRNLMKLNVVVDYRTVSFLITVVCVSCVIDGIVYFLFYLYETYSYGFHAIYWLGDLIYSSTLYTGGMVLLDFAAHVCWLRDRFKQTNDLLKKFFIEECQIKMEEWNNKTVSSWLERCLNEWHVERISHRNKIIPYNGTQIMKRQLYPVNKISMLQQIRYVHLQLCVITKSLKKIFSMQLMCHSTVTTLNFVGVLYYSYTQWTGAPKQSHDVLAFSFLYVIDAFYVWLKVVAVCLLCEKTDNEAKQAAQILQVCSIHNSDFELQHELIQFSVQISLSELDNKKPRLFPLNYMFVVRSMGAVFTYLLVMIQCDLGLNVVSSFSSNSTLTSPSSFNDTILTGQLIGNQTLT
ncbi:uncharacterized protein LOC143212826 isoform X2 [Lasioglossum baleicum]|uniref:uncharacterized protein LOC143212826 isoform X2 n=1 Tax=Lasioglossum baleicum TaxID=434251 RepID=UPI003FCD75C0